jgi:hypothetical protein
VRDGGGELASCGEIVSIVGNKLGILCHAMWRCVVAYPWTDRDRGDGGSA